MIMQCGAASATIRSPFGYGATISIAIFWGGILRLIKYAWQLAGFFIGKTYL